MTDDTDSDTSTDDLDVDVGEGTSDIVAGTQQSSLQRQSKQVQSHCIDGLSPAEAQRDTITAIRVHTRHHDSYEEWERYTRRDVLVSLLLSFGFKGAPLIKCVFLYLIARCPPYSREFHRGTCHTPPVHQQIGLGHPAQRV